MKIQAVTTRMLVLVWLALSFSGFAQAKDQVMLALEVDDGMLVVDRMNTSGPPCQREEHPGCFNIAASDGAEFRVTLNRSHRECLNADWRLLGVWLGGESPVDQPGDKPGTWGGLSAGAAIDFNADAASGRVRTSWQNQHTLQFEDKNKHAFSVWYTVTAQSCHDENVVIELDPRIDNKGTGGSS